MGSLSEIKPPLHIHEKNLETILGTISTHFLLPKKSHNLITFGRNWASILIRYLRGIKPPSLTLSPILKKCIHWCIKWAVADFSFSLYKFIPIWKIQFGEIFFAASIPSTYPSVHAKLSISQISPLAHARANCFVANTFLRKVISGTYCKVLTQPFFTM